MHASCMHRPPPLPRISRVGPGNPKKFAVSRKSSPLVKGARLAKTPCQGAKSERPQACRLSSSLRELLTSSSVKNGSPWRTSYSTVRAAEASRPLPQVLTPIGSRAPDREGPCGCFGIDPRSEGFEIRCQHRRSKALAGRRCHSLPRSRSRSRSRWPCRCPDCV